MPKLYYTAGSCGAATFITASLSNVKLDTELVDLATHKTNSGADYYKINPKGNVPTVVTDGGVVLNENIATLLYTADQNPGVLAPAPNTPERYETLAALSYIATEIHPSVGAFFGKPQGDVAKFLSERVTKKLEYLNTTFIGDKEYVSNNKLSVAVNIYLYIILSWVNYLGGAVDLAPYPKVKGFYDRIAALEGVKKAHARIATNPATSI